MAYSVTITLQAQYVNTTQADNFTIIGEHANGSPSDTTIATNVTKAQLAAGVTYQVADTITGGTVTSTGDCGNSQPWTGLSGGKDIGDPVANNFVFLKCTTDGEAPNSVIITKANWDSVQGATSLPSVGDTITVNGNGNFVNTVVFTFDSTTSDAATYTALTEGDTCPNSEIIRD
jgi:hypothetical protein